MRPEEWNLLHNLAKKHLATNFAADLGDDEEGPDFWPSSITLGAMKQDRWEKYMEHLLHRLRLLREKPRALEEGEECPRIMVKGLISDYDRNKDLSKQPKPEAELELEFDADQVKEYGELNRFVQANWKEMKTRNGAKKMVHLATMELRFWHGCDITWPSTTADAPATCNAPASGRASEAASSRQASRRGVSAAPSAGESGDAAIPNAEEGAGGGGDEDDEEEEEEEEEEENGELPNIFFQKWDPAHPFDINWDRFKYPSLKKLGASHEFHAISLMFFFDNDLAAKFPAFHGKVHKAWKDRYRRTMVFADIMRPPDEGPDEYDDDDKAWLRNTASYYLRKLTPDQREELGISETEATKYLRSGKVMPCLIVSASGPRVDMLCALQDRAQPAAPVLPANATGGGASAAKSSATVAPPPPPPCILATSPGAGAHDRILTTSPNRTGAK